MFNALRTLLIEVQRVEYFSLFDCIFEAMWLVYSSTPEKRQVNKWYNLFEMFEITDIVESKL